MMRILAVDVGTGTQDILLFDSSGPVENCVKLVMPSPTQIAAVPNPEDVTEIEREGVVSVRLTPTAGGSGYNCPCHGGAYDLEGNRTAGPPVRALDRFAFAVQDGRLVFTTRYSVGKVEGEGKNAIITRYGQVPPGVHVDGPEQILYPIEPPN